MKDLLKQKTLTKQFDTNCEQAELTPETISVFQNIILLYYQENKRSFPWRNTNNPYYILVSEIMLQQTQTIRVIGKYEQFIKEFPDFSTLAQAPLRHILTIWQGLGYNRRALALKNIAQQIMYQFSGKLPPSPQTLATLPGIGSYTASAVFTLAFDRPTVFIETNIRTVFIHFFFKDRTGITDREILPLVEKTLDRHSPRNWYYALFDYGAMLKKTKNTGSESAHYHKQTPFKGSNREIRSQILRLLLSHSRILEDKIAYYVNHNPQKIKYNLEQLEREGFLNISNGYVSIE